AFASLAAAAQAALRRDLVELQTTYNIARTPGTTEVAAEYLEVIATRNLDLKEPRPTNSCHQIQKLSLALTTNHMYNKANLAKLKKMDALAPDLMKAFWAFDKISVSAGAIPVKYKELIAVAVALTTQCPYCVDIHSGN